MANLTKREALCISNKCPSPLLLYTYNNNVIKWTDAVHFLGGTHLDWNHNVNLWHQKQPDALMFFTVP